MASAERACNRCTAQKVGGGRCSLRTCKIGPMCWIHTRQNYYVQVKPAKFGQGLFASKPGANADTIVFAPTKDNGHGKGFICFYSKGPFHDTGVLAARHTRKLEYGFGADGKEVNPNKTNDYPGRYANDCNNVAAGPTKYKIAGCNAILIKTRKAKGDDNYVYIKATKPIRNGEEITAPYGPGYWFGEKKTTKLRNTRASKRARYY